jgi:hypothetical protein
MIWDTDPVEGFDLPDECEPDHVVIYPSGDDDPVTCDYYAVPFLHEGTDPDGTDHYREPSDYDPSDCYADAIADRTDLDLDDIDLNRTIPTFEVDPV